MIAEQKPHVRPIKVCFIAPKAYPIFNPAIKEVFGGAQLDLYLLATELAKDPAFKISFITADYGQNADELRENVHLLRSFKFCHNSFLTTWQLLKAMWRADADVYFLKASAAGAFLIAVFSKLRRRPFIYRTASQEECDGTYISKSRWAGALFKQAMRLAKCVLVQNKADGDNLERTIGIKSVHIPNGHRILPAESVAKETILWVGRSAKIKRPDFFIKLARQFPKEHFVMICQKNIDDTEYSSLVLMAEGTQNLEFYEHVPFDQVNRYFLKAKVLVNTSDSEGFPNTFIQAGIAKAAILSLHVNPDDFLERYRCGQSCGGNWERFTLALAGMLQDEAYKAMGENGRRYVENHHDIASIVGRYKELLIKLHRESPV